MNPRLDTCKPTTSVLETCIKSFLARFVLSKQCFCNEKQWLLMLSSMVCFWLVWATRTRCSKNCWIPTVLVRVLGLINFIKTVYGWVILPKAQLLQGKGLVFWDTKLCHVREKLQGSFKVLRSNKFHFNRIWEGDLAKGTIVKNKNKGVCVTSHVISENNFWARVWIGLL